MFKILLIISIAVFLNENVRAFDPLAEAIHPIPTKRFLTHIEKKKVDLGEKLFKDKSLSKDNSVSCMSCHDLFNGGADSHKFSKGVFGRMGKINTPTVMNSSLNFRQFWDGRAKDLETQIDGPISHPDEMSSSWDEIALKLKSSPEYVASFRDAYSSDITGPAIKDAIASFERTLTTPDSPFDRYLKGNKSAISLEAKKGYEIFKTYGCISCHQGVNVGGNMYQTMGVARDYFKDRGNIQKADLGVFNVTGVPEDKHVFKVPSLRNVALTAPYFHDGSAKTLEQAVKVMGRYQLGRELPKEDIDLIVHFLKSLQGTQPSTSKRQEAIK